MLMKLSSPVFQMQKTAAIRLEDIKIKPKETMKRLCKYLGIKEMPTLYESTMQGLKWWGDPSSSLFGQTQTIKSSDDDPIRAETGRFFSSNDQFVLNTLFYPLSAKFGYVEQNDNGFRSNLEKIRPLIEEPLDFEIALSEKFSTEYPDLKMTGAFKYLHATLISTWHTLKENGTYPHMVKTLPDL